MDNLDRDAIRHYEALIAARTPPHLAAALAAARYAHGLAARDIPAAAVRDVVQASDAHRREAGRALAKRKG
jgi:hypothetical protein